MVDGVADATRRLAADVAIGRDRMLFQRFDQAFEQLCSAKPFQDADIAGWASLIGQRMAFCVQRGIHVTTLILPERHVIYADHLPEGASVCATRPSTRLRNVLLPTVARTVLYPLQPLLAGRQSAPMFYRTDQHLTEDGAYTTYRALHSHLASRLAQKPIAPEMLVRRESRLVGDLGIRLPDEPDEAVTYLRIAGPPTSRKVASFTLGGRRADIYENDDATLPRAVWFGDSHSFSLLPFVARHFSRLVVVQTLRFMTDLIEGEQPDFVISQFSELRVGWPKEEGETGPPSLPADGPIGLGEHYATSVPRSPERPLLRIDFAEGGNSDAYCKEGWGDPEETQRWSVGPQCSLRVPAPPRGPAAPVLAIELEPFITPLLLSGQLFEVLINGVRLHAATLVSSQIVKITVPVSGPDADALWSAGGADGTWSILCRHPDARSPAEVGGEDSRVLGMAFRNLALFA